MRINTIDFENIQNRINGARNLQDAGCNDECEVILEKLAKEILDEE